jgi:hypothetical protein
MLLEVASNVMLRLLPPIIILRILRIMHDASLAPNEAAG